MNNIYHENTKYNNFKKRIFEIIQIGNKEDFLSHGFDIFIAMVIITNITVMFLETYKELAKYFPTFEHIEYITLVVFCLEYSIRIWTADYLYPNLTKKKARLRFLISFDGVIDLLTILPFFFLSGFIAFRMLRVVRIFHLFRLNSSYDSFNVITQVLYDKKNQIFSSVFFIIILMLASALGMYSAEHEAQPEVYENAFSCIWWSVSTVLTVGYGDIYPITTAGKMLAILIAFLGVGVVAIPTGIISAGFVEQYTKLGTTTEEKNIQFITVHIDESSSWKNQKVSDLCLPNNIILAVILREKETIIPKGDTLLMVNDHILICAPNNTKNTFIDLHEIKIGENHPWINSQIAELDFSRLSMIVMIKRKERVLIPTDSTIIKQGDNIIMYSKQKIKDSTKLYI